MNNVPLYIDLLFRFVDALLMDTASLNEEQLDHLESVHRQLVRFENEYFSSVKLPLNQFISYLNHDAFSPLTVIVGYGHVLLMEVSGPLNDFQREVVEQFCEVADTLYAELRSYHEALLASRA
ncbi:MAG: hypothetical protein D6712_08285 [Chloroflexi bacterium]|nr:MAG: hypothetical protein D6712_08285 [Chloroflexota bacterium]